MSIASMTEIAFQSRTDVRSPAGFPKTMAENAAAAGGREGAETDVNTALRTLTTYIPTEILTVYVAFLAAVGEAHNAQWWTFYAFLAATPATIWIVFVSKVKQAGKPIPWKPNRWPLWEMCAGSVAYVAWALALPQSPFANLPWYSSAVTGVAVLVASTVLGLLAPLFARALEP